MMVIAGYSDCQGRYKFDTWWGGGGTYNNSTLEKKTLKIQCNL